jgi:hypothetical protein
MSADPPPPDPPTVLAPGITPVSPPAEPVTWAGGLPLRLPARLGRYELLKLLGKGGMGAVYLAHDDQLRRLVAVKVPHFAGPHQFHLRDRFLREARLAATLHHPNLCPVYDCGEVDGVLYLTMAYLEGKPLARFIRPGQQLPPRAVVAVVRQLALAMAEAHAKGVIHRDLKPANIMITPSKQPVIMDFGLARRTDAADPHLTQSGLLMGTPAYMPPEQLNSDVKAMGPATDIYALGVILYELLSGRPPFQGPLGELMTRIMTEPPPLLTRARGDLPPALDAICGTALAKKPGERFASMRAFADALGDYLKGRYKVPDPDLEAAEGYEVVEADARPLDEQDAAGLFRAMAARQVRAARPRRRRPRFRLPEWVIPLVVSAVALGGMGYGLWWFFNNLDRRPHRSAAAQGPAAMDAAQVTEEQQRRAEHEALAAVLQRWADNPADPAGKQELDGWLDSSAGRRIDLPPEVNLGLGKYLLLERDRWDVGLRRLLLTADGPWRKAAELGLSAAVADDPQPWVAAGDAWWSLADTQSGQYRLRLLDRAGLWYGQAAPKLTGAEADRVRRRLRFIDGLRRAA